MDHQYIPWIAMMPLIPAVSKPSSPTMTDQLF
jgi:hypothetical protein